MDEGTRALLQAHLEKARQKQEAAAALLKAGFFEDAVSRAYYAAFHAAQAARELCQAVEEYLAKIGILGGGS